MSTRKKDYITSYSIHYTHSNAQIWRSLQDEWAPSYVPTTLDHVLKLLPHMPQQLQVQPLKLKQKLEYKSHYMYDMIQKDKSIGALTWFKQHNYHYADIQINADWCASSGSCDLSVLLDEKHISAVTVEMNITDIKAVNGHISNVSCGGESTGKSIQCKQNIDSNDCLVVENDDVEGFKELKGVEEDTKLIEDQAALDQCQELTGDPLPTMVQIDNLEN